MMRYRCTFCDEEVSRESLLELDPLLEGVQPTEDPEVFLVVCGPCHESIAENEEDMRQEFNEETRKRNRYFRFFAVLLLLFGIFVAVCIIRDLMHYAGK